MYSVQTGAPKTNEELKAKIVVSNFLIFFSLSGLS
tara:strand:+ start:775 stop:879 length:105 start_codon:yes stop_codon:yes gene_type:complete